MKSYNGVIMNDNEIKKQAEETVNAIFECDKDIEAIDIDHLIHDVLIIKAESLKDQKIFSYADYLENQLMKIKNREAVLK